MLKFRNLRADEIEVRPTDTKGGNATLLLYKDARTDRRILDETVGPENWQCEFYDVNGSTFCRVGIKCDGEWIWKSDCGSESNVEKEKGRASDSFKRACFKWSIGSELYATPKIKIQCPDKYYYNDRMTMTFSVKTFKAEGEEVQKLEIVDRFGNTVYEYGLKKDGVVKYTETEGDPLSYKEEIEDDAVEELKAFCAKIKKVEGTNKTYLRKFFEFYKSKITEDGFKPKNFQKLWDKWLDSPLRREDDKIAKEAALLSDNE